jgi:hypothetical protein
MTLRPPLSPFQVRSFCEGGFTTLRGAFSRQVAVAVCRALGGRIGVDLGDPAQWTEARIWLQENLDEPPFINPLTDRFVAAVDQLVGPGRWVLRPAMGWWPVTFPGFDDVPYAADWHVDGDFRHHLGSQEQAILPLFCFTDVRPDEGGTLLARGSHLTAAGLLAAAGPGGLGQLDLGRAVARRCDESGWDVVEVRADAGDVVLCHPLLLHASNPNHGPGPRVMAQPRFDLVGPRRIRGGNLSPVEQAVRLGAAGEVP